MERVLGIGGYFLRAADPAALALVPRVPGAGRRQHGVWQQEAGPTVFAAFAADTDYFGSPTQQTMLNFRVGDLDAMLAQLRAAGAAVDRRPRTWRVSAGSAGSPTRRATGSSSGSPADPAPQPDGQTSDPPASIASRSRTA